MNRRDTIKSEKINRIISVAAGRPYKVIKARPTLDFILIDKDRKLFRCVQTGQELTWLQIQQDVIVNTKNFVFFCSIEDCPEDPNLVYYTKLHIMGLYNDEIFFLDEPVEYLESIHLNIEEYMKKQDRENISI